jgi:Domain of unknown function (DUF5679)
VERKDTNYNLKGNKMAKCLFCDQEAIHTRKVPNRDATVELCDEHYNDKTSGEILEFYRDNIENTPKDKSYVEIGHCMHCKDKREMLQVEEGKLKNGRSTKTGFCAKCNTKIVKIVKSA